MISISYAREMALHFENTEEKPHFERISFRVKDKIFATLDSAKKQLVIKLSPEEQYAFGVFNKEAIFPVEGAWGKQGWTIVELDKIGEDIFRDALITSYCNVAPKKLGEKYRSSE
jgi:predicted DNA-binding protein (MmcQ/YjbR family)